ncbi:hypothetical protein HRO26_09085 [Treponema pectinovorum]|uniref:hypothetical protein n=1 Tax=Treponema pectinovorum TaxID=164 RepID=UPI0011F3E017|nr:hypothetical protein [Treponema pectinovorum]
MKFFNKYNTVSFALLLLVLVVQLVPFTNSTKIESEVEDAGKTWAELPIGVTGKDRSSWPSEIKYGEFKDWDVPIKEKYPLYGERQISIFTYVWNPAGALYGYRVGAYILPQVMFIAFAIFTFLVKNFMAKAVVAFIFGLTHIWAFAKTLMLTSSGNLEPYMAIPVLLLILGLALIAVGIWCIPQYFRDKAHNEHVRKSL